MKINKTICFPVILSVLLLALTTPILAQPNYILFGKPVSSAKTIGGGDYLLSGSVGQPEAGTPLSGGEFTLNGGLSFEGSTVDVDESFIYLPILLRN